MAPRVRRETPRSDCFRESRNPCQAAYAGFLKKDLRLRDGPALSGHYHFAVIPRSAAPAPVENCVLGIAKGLSPNVARVRRWRGARLSQTSGAQTGRTRVQRSSGRRRGRAVHACAPTLATSTMPAKRRNPSPEAAHRIPRPAAGVVPTSQRSTRGTVSLPQREGRRAVSDERSARRYHGTLAPPGDIAGARSGALASKADTRLAAIEALRLALTGFKRWRSTRPPRGRLRMTHDIGSPCFGRCVPHTTRMVVTVSDRVNPSAAVAGKHWESYLSAVNRRNAVPIQGGHVETSNVLGGAHNPRHTEISLARPAKKSNSVVCKSRRMHVLDTASLSSMVFIWCAHVEHSRTNGGR